MINTVIFDLDGTLLDTSEGIIESVRYTIMVLGLEELPYCELLKFIGPPIQVSFQHFYGFDGEQAQHAADTFRDYYMNKGLNKAVPYEGIYTLCDRLRGLGIQLSVATYKRETYAIDLLKHFGFDQYCHVMHGGDRENRLSKADIIGKCIRELSCDPGRSLYVGDTVSDASSAEAQGLRFVAALYGFGFRTLEDAEAVRAIGAIWKPEELLAFV